MEWATGHGGAQFFVFLKAADEHHLKKISRRMLWQYLAEAPPEAWAYFNDVEGHERNPNASANLAWRKVHLRRYPQLGPGTIADDSMYRLDQNKPLYVPNQPEHAPTWVERPWGKDRWTCARPAPSGPLVAHVHPDAARRYLGYTDAKHCGTQACGQRRASYTNANFPWIVGVHMFAIQWVYARSADAAHFAFPPGTAPGSYIGYFMWCVAHPQSTTAAAVSTFAITITPRRHVHFHQGGLP